MAIGSLPPVTNEIQANSGQPGKTLAQQTAANSLLDLQAAATEPAAAIVPETTLIEQAVAEALGRQGGLAPLYATLAELVAAPDLPDALKAAVETVLAFRLGDGDVTPERVAQAIRSSGLFHEAAVAGKMAATLPPTTRQALGATPEQKQQAATRSAGPAPSPVISAAVSKPASPASSPVSLNTGAAPNAAVTASVAQAYGRQAALPASMITPTASQALGLSGAIGPVPASETVDVGVAAAPVAPSAAAAAGPSATALPAGSDVASSTSVVLAPANLSAAPAQSIIAGQPLPTTEPAMPGSTAISPSAAEGVSEASAPVPTRVPSPGEAETHSTPPAVGGTVASTSSPVISAAMMTVPGSEGQPVPGRAALPPGGSAPPSVSTPVPVSHGPEAPASPFKAPMASPAPNAGVAASSRSFAPWTPGRALIPAAPQASPGMPAVSSPGSGHPAPTPAIAPAGGETARPVGDRAPFVPSAVENLPATSSAAAAPGGRAIPVGPLSISEVPQQQPGVTQPVSPTSGGQPQPAVPLSQGVVQPGQSAASQIRPLAPPTGAEIISSARPSSPQPPVTAAATAAMGVDLKGALALLRRELVTWLGRNADVMASLDGADNEAPVPRADRPAPPRKAGPVRGQPAVPLLGSDEAEAASTETLAGRALGEAERSLSRVFLHQAATADSRDMKASQTAQAFMFEIPIAGPTGTSIAQFRIERDDHAPTEPGAPPRRVFQVDIAFDIAPLGPVAVRVGLMDGRRVAVGVWCESDDGLVRMEAERENIVLGLEQEGMVVAGVDLHRGHPPEGRDETAVVANHRLDLQL